MTGFYIWGLNYGNRVLWYIVLDLFIIRNPPNSIGNHQGPYIKPTPSGCRAAKMMEIETV